MNTLLRDKRKGGNPMRKLPPQRSSVKSLMNVREEPLMNVIRIIQLTLGCVELFFNRGRNGTELRACQFT